MIANLLGLDAPPEELTLGQMASRAVVVFFAGIAFLRMGARRQLGRNAGFDVLLLVVLGSVLSRAITGEAAFLPTLGAGLCLVLMHWGLSWLASRVHWISRGLKGQPIVIVRAGVLDEAALRSSAMSRDDLEANLRLRANLIDLAQVEEARLERNGEVSVIRREAGRRGGAEP